MRRFPLLSSSTGSARAYRLADSFSYLRNTLTVEQGRFPPYVSTPDWVPDSIPSTLFYYDNRSRLEGPLSSIADRSSNGWGLNTHATASRQPEGYLRHWEFNGQPALAFNAAASSYARDETAGALTRAKVLHAPGVAIAVLCSVLSDGQVLGTWTIGTSNMNAVSLYGTSLGLASSATLSWAVTSRPGVVHLNVSTPAGWARPGDVVFASLIHRSNRSYAVKFVRAPRWPGDPGATYTATGTSTGTVDAGDSDYGLTLGGKADLSTFTSSRIYAALACVAGSTTDADFAKLEATWVDATTVPFLPFAVDTPITSTHLGDGTHGDVTYHDIAGKALRVLEAGVATELGVPFPLARVGVIGDSRPAGAGITGVTLGVNDMRTVVQAGSFPYTRQAVGPVDDGTGTAWKFHFARSGYVTRTNGGSPGHSQRTPSGTTIDNWWGAGKAYNSTSIVSWFLGVNDLSRPAERDYVDEFVRMNEYIRTSALGAAQSGPGVALLNEPITGTTTNGTMQYLIRARNRGYHAAVRYLRTLMPVQMGNLNDTTYFP